LPLALDIHREHPWNRPTGAKKSGAHFGKNGGERRQS
jgi:hypothetical protein